MHSQARKNILQKKIQNFLPKKFQQLLWKKIYSLCPVKLQNETTNSTKFLPIEEANLRQNVNLAKEINLEIMGKKLHKQKDTRIFATVP